MDITSFILGMKMSGGDKEQSDFNANIAAAMITRNPEYLGDKTVLNLREYLLPDGKPLGNMQPYAFSGFFNITHFVSWPIILIPNNAFCGSTKLKVLDLQLNDLGSIFFWADALNTLTDLEAVIIRRFGNNPVKTVSFVSGSTAGANEDFYVYVPRDDYETVISNIESDDDVPASRYRILEDYPEYDRWNETCTVRYFDGDTLLKTVTVKMGGNASYTPTKDGYKLAGWDKDVTKVTEDMDVYAVWMPASIADATWSEIAAAAESGLLSKAYSVGDEKDITITYADGTTETVTMVLEGFNNDTLADKTSKSGAVFLAKNALKTTRQMKNKSTAVVYPNTPLSQWLNGELFNGLPSDLQSVIKEKMVSAYGSAKCWVPSNTELGLTSPSGYEDYYCSAYSRYYSNARRIKNLGADGAATDYWTRSYSQSDYGRQYCYIYASGGQGYGTYAYDLKGVVVGFCI